MSTPTSRRSFLKHGAATLFLAGGGALATGGSALAATPSPPTVDLGLPSGGDDSAAINKALASAAAGSRLALRTGRTYRLANSLLINRPDLWLDLNGATLVPITRSGNLATQDAYIEVWDTKNAHVSGGTFAAGTSFAQASMAAGKVRLLRSVACTVENITMSHAGKPSAAVDVFQGSDHTIRGITATGLAITGISCQRTTVSNCTLHGTAADQNGMSFLGYSGAPLVGLTLSGNHLSGYGRWGVEVTIDSSAATQADIRGTVVTGNTFGAPMTGVVCGALSCAGLSATITSNVMTDVTGYGIEVGDFGHVIQGNTIARTTVPASGDPSLGIVVDGTDAKLTASLPRTVVKGNKITGMRTGVLAVHDSGPFTIDSNTIVSPRYRSLDLCGGRSLTINANTLRFDAPGDAGTRVGICHWTDAAVTGNTLSYVTGYASGDTTEVPIYAPGGPATTSSGNAVTGLPA